MEKFIMVEQTLLENGVITVFIIKEIVVIVGIKDVLKHTSAALH